MNEKIKFYSDRITLKEKELAFYKGKSNLVSVLRLVDALILVVFLANYFFGNSFKSISLVFIVVSIIVFIALIKWHNTLDEEINSIKGSIDLNQSDIRRLNKEWKEFKDDGKEYVDFKHPFIYDLDIFGSKSFFQWVNATRTAYGRKSLSEKLIMKKLPSKNNIYRMQKTLKELANKYEFRELFLSALLKQKAEKKNFYLLEWAKEDNKQFLSAGISILKILAPIITCVTLILTILGKVNILALLILFGINFMVMKLASKDAISGIDLFDELKRELFGYVNALELLEGEEFQSDILKTLQQKLVNRNEKKASEALKELYELGSWFNDRHNAFYIVFNVMFYWDYHLLARAEKWKQNYKDDVEVWMEVVGEFEALESLSIVVDDNSIFPVINDGLVIEAENLVHPMLFEDGVYNSFNLNKEKRVALVTGSNMSGKSTFLRTIGFSMFLTYLGLPVRAKQLSVPIVNIYTCMRTGDNMNESISSFYAEILRVKNIVEASENGERILFLLDEIFKGTNSIDRHEGAQVLITQLLKFESIGIVSTHDFELCDMEKTNSSIINYNFREYYENNKLYFDYKLRNGVSTTRNARYLMKMAGIEI
ncbi:MAG: MutS family DNA mismatch repair protein [Sarcina sp.]